MTERAPEPQEPPADMRVHVTTQHRTVGDALFAVADAAKRAAPTPQHIDAAAKILAIGVVVLMALGALLAGGVWLYEQNEREKREARETREAEAAAQAEAALVPKRRAVLDLLDPGRVPMLCPLNGEVIGRVMVKWPMGLVREMMGPCPVFGVDCKSRVAFYNCTPATQLEIDAWDRAYEAPYGEQELAKACRAVVGVDPNPQVKVVDVDSGQLYTIGRGQLHAGLQRNPRFFPATPAQIVAWETAMSHSATGEAQGQPIGFGQER